MAVRSNRLMAKSAAAILAVSRRDPTPYCACIKRFAHCQPMVVWWRSAWREKVVQAPGHHKGRARDDRPKPAIMTAHRRY
jgi:hypothetical protein